MIVGGKYLSDEQIYNLLIRYKRELEGLTPGGSEFVNEPELCSEWIRTAHNKTIKALKDIILRKGLKYLLEVVNFLECDRL